MEYTDVVPWKLFVGGLSLETDEDKLKEYFSKFGEVDSISVKTDQITGRPRGFAFIVFSKSDTIDKVLNTSEHVINGKKVDVKHAKARPGKIFVGGLKPELSDADIKHYFEKYGTVVDIEIPFDNLRNQRKGFCFVTFEQGAVVTEVLRQHKQNINGIEVDVKKATPKADDMGMMQGGMTGAYGASGGMRGRDWTKLRPKMYNKPFQNQGEFSDTSYGQGYGGGYRYYDAAPGYIRPMLLPPHYVPGVMRSPSPHSSFDYGHGRYDGYAGYRGYGDRGYYDHGWQQTRHNPY